MRRYLPSFPEEWLHRMWAEIEPVCRPLKTVDGRSVRILDPGIPNVGDGPDMLDSTLALDGIVHRGDVEFHFATGDWYSHRHDRDPRYANVILHVVLRHTSMSFYVRHDGGARVPVVELLSHLRVAPGSLAHRLAQMGDRPQCPLPLDARGRGAWPDRLDDLAEVRLLGKAARLADRMRRLGADEALYRAVADALGYSANRTPFAKLVERVPLAWSRGRPLPDVEATFLGVAGLLPSQTADKRVASARDPETAAIEARWQRLEDRPLPLHRAEWRFLRSRQGNSPTRRVVALAHLAARMGDGLLARLIAVTWEEVSRSGWRRRWGLFQPPAGGYWATHSDFGVRVGPSIRALVGESRARDIWVNVAIPALIALAERRGDEDLRQRAFALYRAHPPLQSNHKTRWVVEHALRMSAGADRREPARRQQGMLELYATYCRPRRCAECPLLKAASDERRAYAEPTPLLSERGR